MSKEYIEIEHIVTYKNGEKKVDDYRIISYDSDIDGDRYFRNSITLSSSQMEELKEKLIKLKQEHE